MPAAGKLLDLSAYLSLSMSFIFWSSSSTFGSEGKALGGVEEEPPIIPLRAARSSSTLVSASSAANRFSRPVSPDSWAAKLRQSEGPGAMQRGHPEAKQRLCGGYEEAMRGAARPCATLTWMHT